MDHGSHSERRVGIGLESADLAVAGKPFNGSGVLQSGRCRSNFAAQEPCCGPIGQTATRDCLGGPSRAPGVRFSRPLDCVWSMGAIPFDTAL